MVHARKILEVGHGLATQVLDARCQITGLLGLALALLSQRTAGKKSRAKSSGQLRQPRMLASAKRAGSCDS